MGSWCWLRVGLLDYSMIGCCRGYYVRAPNSARGTRQRGLWYQRAANGTYLLSHRKIRPQDESRREQASMPRNRLKDLPSNLTARLQDLEKWSRSRAGAAFDESAIRRQEIIRPQLQLW
jgi:hypothetical protein